MPKNIDPSPEKLFLERLILEKFTLAKEGGISPERLLCDRSSASVVPESGKCPKDSGTGPVSRFRLRSMAKMIGSVESDGGIEPKSLLKERSRNLSFLRYARKWGMGPERLLQLISRESSCDNSPMAGGISPTRRGFLWNRRNWRWVSLAIAEGMVPEREPRIVRLVTKSVVSSHSTTYQPQQSLLGSHEGKRSGFERLFLNSRRAAWSSGLQRSPVGK